ncbi:MAG: pseudouridine synthase [Lachnospiraceae bacterium]|nr:pseudouridine synthase [Lachnospiraceae bacterium]
MAEEMRLNKYLASCGVCSRREADKLIADGKVSVNGRAASMGTKVSSQDTVLVNGKAVKTIEEKHVLAFYKPIGVTCTEKDAHADKIIADFIDYPVRVTYAGRLDKESEGLMILTNDGSLIDAMMKGANGHDKEYIVKVDKEITEGFLKAMAAGVYLKELDITTRQCDIKKIGKFTFQIVLTQGVNRQIRRMCQTLGFRVLSLKRVRIMNILQGDVAPGKYRKIEGEELETLYRQCGLPRPI